MCTNARAAPGTPAVASTPRRYFASAPGRTSAVMSRLDQVSFGEPLNTLPSASEAPCTFARRSRTAMSPRWNVSALTVRGPTSPETMPGEIAEPASTVTFVPSWRADRVGRLALARTAARRARAARRSRRGTRRAPPRVGSGVRSARNQLLVLPFGVAPRLGRVDRKGTRGRHGQRRVERAPRVPAPPASDARDGAPEGVQVAEVRDRDRARAAAGSSASPWPGITSAGGSCSSRSIRPASVLR